MPRDVAACKFSPDISTTGLISGQGTNDVVYTVANAQEEIKLFTNSPEARLIVVKDGQHFLSASHPHEVDSALIDFVKRWHK